MKKIFTSGLFVLLAIAIEAYTFLKIGWGFFPKYPLFDIAIILAFSFVIFSIGKRWIANTLIGVFLGIEIVLSYINIIMKSTMNNTFTIKMLSLVGETVEVLTFDMILWLPFLFYGIIIAILITALVFIGKIRVDKLQQKKFRKHLTNLIVSAGLALSMLFYTVQGMFLKKGYLIGDDYLYESFFDGQQSLKKFGLVSFYFEDILRSIDVRKKSPKLSRADVEKYLASETYNPTDSPLFGVANGNNVIVIMAESFEWYGISKELTPVLYALANGYDFGTAGERLYDIYDFENECEDGTLMRKDYIYDEEYYCIGKSGGDVSYDDTYDNTYGLTLINYYSKAKTDYSESSVILGNYPFNRSFVERTSFGGTNLFNDVDYCFTLPSMLKESGYINEGDTWYYHTYKSKFYGREDLMPMFGFDKTTFYEDIVKNENIEHEDRLSHAIRDSEFMRYYGDEFVHLDEGNAQDTPWLTFFTTVTTHGEYSTYNERLYKNYMFLDHAEYAGKPETSIMQYVQHNTTKEAKNFWKSVDGCVTTYLAGCLDTEYMVARLIDKLIQTNQFDNTTIVFFADHNGYYNQLDLLYKPYFYDSDYPEYSSFRIDYLMNEVELPTYDIYSSERYSVPAFIYATALDSAACGTELDELNNEHKIQYIEKFTCAFDILPTIFTLCGIEYDPHYYMGYPVMCKMQIEDELVEVGTEIIISHTGGYFNNNIYSEDGTTAKYIIDKDKIKYFKESCVRHLEKWYYITALYEYNMFRR